MHHFWITVNIGFQWTWHKYTQFKGTTAGLLSLHRECMLIHPLSSNIYPEPALISSEWSILKFKFSTVKPRWQWCVPKNVLHFNSVLGWLSIAVGCGALQIGWFNKVWTSVLERSEHCTSWMLSGLVETMRLSEWHDAFMNINEHCTSWPGWNNLVNKGRERPRKNTVKKSVWACAYTVTMIVSVCMCIHIYIYIYIYIHTHTHAEHRHMYNKASGIMLMLTLSLFISPSTEQNTSLLLQGKFGK